MISMVFKANIQKILNLLMSKDLLNDFSPLSRSKQNIEDNQSSTLFSSYQLCPDFSDLFPSHSTKWIQEQIIDIPNPSAPARDRRCQKQDQKYKELEKQHQKLKEKYRLLEQKLKQSESQNERLNGELLSRKQKEKGTKSKLRDWVVLAKQNLNQTDPSSS